MSETVPSGEAVRVALSDATDRLLLDLITKGRPVIDEATGEHRKGADGKLIYKPASAADINTALKRLAQMGVAPSADAADEDSVPGKLKKNLEQIASRDDLARDGLRLNPAPKGWKPPIPPLDVEARDAAGA